MGRRRGRKCRMRVGCLIIESTGCFRFRACPDSVKMLTESGLLYLKAGQVQDAFERLGAALALEPTCGKALLGVGCITQVLLGFWGSGATGNRIEH